MGQRVDVVIALYHDLRSWDRKKSQESAERERHCCNQVLTCIFGFDAAPALVSDDPEDGLWPNEEK